MKNKGCPLSGSLTSKAKLSDEKFSKSKNLRNFDLLGAMEIRVVWKVAIFTAKGTSLRECTSFEPFYVKIGWAV